MIDPKNITNFERTDDELIEFLIFGASVQGKTSSTQARLLDKFIFSLPQGKGLRNRLHRAIKLGRLGELLQESRLGQYTRLEKVIHGILELDLGTCSCEELETIHGIGPKTARMFLMHSRPNQRIAALDVHILRFLKKRGIDKVPAVTPCKGPTYRRLESEFLRFADKAKMTPADFDLKLWTEYSTTTSKKAA